MTIKILNIGLSKNPGGVENLILNYYRNINKKIFKFDIIDIYGEGIAFDKEYINLGSDIYTLHNYKKRTLSFIIDFIKVINNNKYDIIHIHMQSAANILVVLLSLISKKSIVVCHSHSTSTPKGLVRMILNYFNKFILRILPIEKWACGQKAGKWLWGGNFDEKNIVYNAIDYNKYKFDKNKRNELRKKLNISNETILLGFVGRFGDEKNVFFLIDILSRLKKEYLNKYKLVTIGDGDLKDKFIDRIKEENLLDYYVDLGVISDTSEVYNIMDVFLLPSFFEGIPVVAVESQSNGLMSLLSSNISREVAISEKIKFLNINNIELWIDSIKSIEISYDRLDDVNYNYKIINASKNLEQKYINILNYSERIDL